MNPSSHDKQVQGQVALITGGGRGIGRVMARTLAKEGMAVAVLARTVEELDETVAIITQEGGRALRFQADVTNQDAIQQVVAAVTQHLGPVDLLVNNAAVNQPMGALWEVDADEWWRCMEINLRGPLLCTKAVLPGMIERRRGRIVNVTSGVFIRPWVRYSGYNTSKAALVRFTENLAAEIREYGLQAFSIDPGPVSGTGMTGDAAARWAEWGIIALPPERAADLVRELATGNADILSGAFISVYDDVDNMVRKMKWIDQDNMYPFLVFSASNGDFFLPRGRI